MKRNETKTRTVWYVQACVDGRFEDRKAFKAYADAWDFISDANLNDINARIVEAKVVGSSSYPEMVNARYEDSLKATAPVVEESNPSGNKIRWKYQVQVQTANKVGWIDLRGSMPDGYGEFCNYLFDTEKEAQKVCSDIALSEWNDVARIKKVGELI